MRMQSALLLLATSVVLAGCASHSHYAGMQTREIKSLSSADIDGLRAGKGMGLALPAELNGYPGPLHVLELAERLSLSAEQRAATVDLQARMKSAAFAAGEGYLAAELALDRLFSDKSVTPERLRAALQRSADAQAAVREAHLQAHLAQARILTPDQVAQYNKQRGYAR